MKIVIPKNNTESKAPSNYYFITDLSGSMYSAQKQLRETLKAAKDLISQGDTFSLAYFSSYGDFNWICKGSTISSKGLDKIIEDNIYVRGLTCFTQVLESLKTVVKDVETLSQNSDNVLYFLTDGYPNDHSPTHEVLSLSKELRDKFTQKRIVGYSSYYNRSLLIEMAENIGGVFNHISDFTEMKKSASDMISNKKTVVSVKLPQSFDLVWQVTDSDILPLEVKADNTVSALATKKESELFAVNYNELNTLPAEQLNNPTFVYSLAQILSQKNKANLGVLVLRKAGDNVSAKKLQKAFTVLQKGQAENFLKEKATSLSAVEKSDQNTGMTLTEFLKNIKKDIGKVTIDLHNSQYKSISRKGNDTSKIEFETSVAPAKIVNIVGNENRANISFLTVREGKIKTILDEDLKNRVLEFNARSTTPIILPIESTTYRNYAFVANGDFNFGNIVLHNENTDKVINLVPNDVIDLFDEEQKDLSIQTFSNLYKALISEKAHASVLRMYIKAHATQKHSVDKRVELYGTEGAALLEEMGLDYAMRYSPKSEYKSKDENADFIPFVELTAQLKGASKITASESYKKYLANGKQNPGDVICWPLFKKYDEQLNNLGKETFVEFCQKTLEGVEDTVELLAQKISSQKFYMMVTNSWFTDIDKSEKFEYNDLVFKISEVNEYL
jgi:hypothetical protein